VYKKILQSLTEAVEIIVKIYNFVEYSSYGSSSYYSTDEYSDETEETDEPSASGK